jgi:hypothetical protein
MTRLRGIPILFFSGSENAVFDPQSTDISYTRLRDTFGEEWYGRVVFEGRGHLDCVRIIDLLEFFIFRPRNMCCPLTSLGVSNKKVALLPKILRSGNH